MCVCVCVSVRVSRIATRRLPSLSNLGSDRDTVFSRGEFSLGSNTRHIATPVANPR